MRQFKFEFNYVSSQTSKLTLLCEVEPSEELPQGKSPGGRSNALNSVTAVRSRLREAQYDFVLSHPSFQTD